MYLINDIGDRKKDREHPKKRFRAIASGRLSVKAATIAASFFIAVGLIVSFFIGSFELAGAICSYLIFNLIYTFSLKHIPIVDVFLVGSMYGIRILSSFIATSVFPDMWWLWVVCGTLLATAIELGKRKCESMHLGTTGTTRKTLTFYTEKTMHRMYLAVSLLTSTTFFLAATPVSLYIALGCSPIIYLAMRRFNTLISKTESDIHPQEVILGDKLILTYLGAFGMIFIASATQFQLLSL